MASSDVCVDYELLLLKRFEDLKKKRHDRANNNKAERGPLQLKADDGAAVLAASGQKLPSRFKRASAGQPPGAAGAGAPTARSAAGGAGPDEEADRLAKKARLQAAADARERARLLLAAKMKQQRQQEEAERQQQQQQQEQQQDQQQEQQRKQEQQQQQQQQQEKQQVQEQGGAKAPPRKQQHQRQQQQQQEQQQEQQKQGVANAHPGQSGTAAPTEAAGPAPPAGLPVQPAQRKPSRARKLATTPYSPTHQAAATEAGQGGASDASRPGGGYEPAGGGYMSTGPAPGDGASAHALAQPPAATTAPRQPPAASAMYNVDFDAVSSPDYAPDFAAVDSPPYEPPPQPIAPPVPQAHPRPAAAGAPGAPPPASQRPRRQATSYDDL